MQRQDAHQYLALLLRKPINGIGLRAACCARAATGHAAAPTSPVMNSRRLMGLSP
jgi:hypothetical protein